MPPGGDVATLFPVTVQDRARNIYIAYVPECGTSSDSNGNAAPPLKNPACFHVYYVWASAKDGWSTFHGPFQVDAPPQSSTAVMPWAAAGGNGVLDVAWYGSSKRENPSYNDPGLGKAWYAYMTQVTHAASNHPRMAMGQVSPHPMHYNSICLDGTGCITEQGNRNMADFFEVTIDPQGRARVVYTDTSNGLIQAGFSAGDGISDHAGADEVTTNVQQTGVDAWTGKPLKPEESTAPVSHITDPSGDSLVNKTLGGTYDPAADIRRVALKLHGGNLTIKVTTQGGTLGAAAQAADAAFGQLVVRWQMGNTIYYAEAEQDASGASTQFYAGKVQSIDLCSVSACDPHYFVYPGVAAGGNLVTGSVNVGQQTVYTITVPVADIGGASGRSLLEEVAAYVFAAPESANLVATNAQAQAEQGIPTEIDGTRAFNFR
jgi:hypothetical protein